jgi:hypothetical protein
MGGASAPASQAIMSKHANLVEKILLGTADANIPFDGLCVRLQKLGFQMRVRGSHHTFHITGVEETNPEAPAPSRIR